VNVTVENLGPCKKLLRVEVDVQAVDAAFESALIDFQKHANLAGFRPGKAPRQLIAKTYASQIEAEVKKKLIPDSYRKALEEQKLTPVGYPDIEEIQFGRGQVLQFAATVETEPDFELPDYKGLPIQRGHQVVTDEDLDRALGMLVDQKSTHVDVARPVQTGDFVVVNYQGTCEGKPVVDWDAAARGLSEQKNFWLHIAPESFVPGFTEQLIGAQAGERRTVNTQFPTEFVSKVLAGKPAVYEVEVVQVKEKILPPLDDAFAKTMGAEDLEKLKAAVRVDLENELKYKQKRETRDQLVAVLLGRVTCELPESLVEKQTKHVVYDIVRTNAERGIAKEDIDKHKDEIYNVAATSAKERVKVSLILSRIAEKEGIQASREEITQRILQMARQNDIKPEKLVKQLQERGAIAEIQEQIVNAKVLDLLELNAVVQEGTSPAAP